MTTKSRGGQIDYVLLLTVFALLVFGVVMITSIGVPKSISLTKPAEILFPTCGEGGVDCYFLLKRHALRVGIALVGFFIALKIPYRFWRKTAIPFFIAVFGLLMAVFVIGSANNTFAKSWINLYGNSIQPSEIAKIAVIFYLARWIESRGSEIRDFKSGFLSFVVLVFVIVLPILMQPDFGSTLVLTAIAATLYILARAKWRHILLGVASVAVLAMIVVPTIPRLKYRFLAFVRPTAETCEPEVPEGATKRNYCWQVEQASIAVGSGGFFGKGLTQGIQKSYWLPQATDDFIFAASAEELGFVRTLLVVFAYLLFAYRGFLIVRRAPDRFGMLAAAGITVWLTFQAFLNIAVNLGLFPITGITLPFISYGGTSMLVSLFAVGVLLNISKSTTPYATRTDRRRNRRPYYA